jgi:hypothetical protein
VPKKLDPHLIKRHPKGQRALAFLVIKPTEFSSQLEIALARNQICYG